MSLPRYPRYKESGIEWLGEVPEHWEVKPFRCCIDFQEGPGIMAVDFRDSGVPLLRISGVQEAWASLEGCNYLDPERVEKTWLQFRLVEGDLLISASASMGTVCEVGPETAGSIPYTGLIRLRGIAGKMIRPFIRHLVVSTQFSTQIDLLKAGATIQHFGPTHLSRMRIVSLPIDEQEAVAAFLELETGKINALVEEQQRLIELLKEKRQAVISQAVTKGLNPSVPMKDSGADWLGPVPAHWRVERAGHLFVEHHGCPVKSRIDSIGCGSRIGQSGSRRAEVPVKWGFSRKG